MAAVWSFDIGFKLKNQPKFGLSQCVISWQNYQGVYVTFFGSNLCVFLKGLTALF